MSTGGSKSVIVKAMLANLGIAVAKFAGAFVSGSAALLAEAIHSLVDSTNQVLLLVGHRSSQRAPNEKHPLGYGREAFFWSFIVAVLLFSLGGIFSIYEGTHKLGSTETISAPLLGLSILIVSLGLEWYSFKACLREVAHTKGKQTYWQWFKSTTAADLLVVFTEDAAAMLGLVLATASLLLTWVTGNPFWDAAGSIAIGIVLVLVAALLAVEIRSLMIGEAPTENYRPFIEEILKRELPDGKLLRYLALQIGSSEVMLAYKIHPGTLTEVSRLIDSINHIETAVKQKYPEIRWQFVEPDWEA